MPPRIPAPSVVSSTSTLLQTHIWTGASTSAAAAGSSANFSTTASCDAATVARRAFRKWLSGPGSNYVRPKRGGGPNYLPQLTSLNLPPNSNIPFPLNPQFRSAPVLDDRARELIWEKVMRKGEPIKAVSAELGVDITRVAAVVRLKEVEKDWIAKVCIHLSSLVIPAFIPAPHFLHAFP